MTHESLTRGPDGIPIGSVLDRAKLIFETARGLGVTMLSGFSELTNPETSILLARNRPPTAP